MIKKRVLKRYNVITWNVTQFSALNTVARDISKIWIFEKSQLFKDRENVRFSQFLLVKAAQSDIKFA